MTINNNNAELRAVGYGPWICPFASVQFHSLLDRIITGSHHGYSVHDCSTS